VELLGRKENKYTEKLSQLLQSLSQSNDLSVKSVHLVHLAQAQPAITVYKPSYFVSRIE
jgi:hypothetical protein